ncbi:MAG: hypothetical protein JSS60_00845 [Verrucomicrobia bacterium]|nr:hypothetical protein [Verrucomicrobiota bacterium]
MHKMKTSLLAFALSCAAVNCFADTADNETSFSEQESPKLLIEEKAVLVVQNNTPSSSTQVVLQEMQPSTSPTPSSMARLQNNHCCEPYLSADYLLWTVRQDNMSYCIPSSNQLSNSATLIKNKVQNPDWKWGSGFRVGAGLNFRHDGWDTYIIYTRFHPEAADGHRSLKEDEQTLIPTFPATAMGGFTNNTFDSAKTRWSFEFDAIDWVLGRNFYVSRYLTLRPFAGLKTAWIEQSQYFRYHVPLNVVRGFDELTFFNKNHQDFWGIGTEIGLDTAWYVYKKNLSIIADLTLSALWGRFELSQKQRFIDSTLGQDFTNFNLRDGYHAIRPVIEWSLGMQWESWLYRETMKFSMMAAWEEQVWFNQNNFATLSTSVPQYGERGGDLSMQGLTLRGRFDF